jgi:hypothetical protein
MLTPDMKSIKPALSTMSDEVTLHILDLPRAWFALLFQHVASGPGGLANAAALSQTSKFLHSMSEGPAVTYSNLFVIATISSPDHPFWHWLAKRDVRIAGLKLDLCWLNDGAAENADQLPDWMQPLQTLSGIPGVLLDVKCVGGIADVDHACIAQLLKPHGRMISHLVVELHVSEDRLKLREFSEAAAPCRSIDLTIWHSPGELIDLADLQPVAASLHDLICESDQSEWCSLRGTSALISMSQLTALHLAYEDLGSEEPWDLLAKLTSLQQLYLDVCASGDASPLSALTGLSSLNLESCLYEANDRTPLSFSSLQPLSTLQQLEELYLYNHVCTATSLQGLAGLKKLKKLVIESYDCGTLLSLKGISPGVVEVSIVDLPDLMSLAGIEGCTSMEKLTMCSCGVSSLQPLRGLAT